MKGKNKIFAVLLAMALVVGLMPVGNFSALAEDGGASREWQATDFDIEGPTIKGLSVAGQEQLKARGGKLEFPAGMTDITIGTSAFEGNKELKSFSWDRVKKIENKAFKDCALEGELIVPDGFAWIGNEAFRNNRITKVHFPDDIKTVGPYAFADNQIEELHLGALTNLTGSRWSSELNIENGGILSYGLFRNNKIRAVDIPKKVGGKGIWAIGVAAFAQNDLQELTIPSTLENIYFNGFEKNPNLKSVVFETEEGSDGIKRGIRQIDRDAFAKCSINKIEFPDYLGEMGGRVFSENQLKEVTVPAGGILGYYIFQLNPLEKITFKRYAYYDGSPEGGTVAGQENFRIPLKNVSFDEYILNPGGRKSTTFFVEDMFKYGMLKSIEAPCWITEVKKDSFIGNEGWYEGTKRVAIYRKNVDGNYVVSNDVKDGDNHVFNPVLLDVQIVNQKGHSFIPDKPIKIKCTRIDKTGTPHAFDFTSIGGADYQNCKLGDQLEIELPDLGERIKFLKTNAQKAGNKYKLSLAPDSATIEDVAYGDGYEVGYKKATLKVEYNVPKKPSKPKPEEEPKPEDPKPPVTQEDPKPDTPKEPEVTPTPEPPAPTPEPPTYRPGRTPDPNDPASPDVIEIIGDDGVPLGTFKKHTNPDGTVEYINEDNVPLGDMKLVATGNEFPELPLMGVAIVSLLGAAFVLLRREGAK